MMAYERVLDYTNDYLTEQFLYFYDNKNGRHRSSESQYRAYYGLFALADVMDINLEKLLPIAKSILRHNTKMLKKKDDDWEWIDSGYVRHINEKFFEQIRRPGV